jgi:hypothetical protein
MGKVSNRDNEAVATDSICLPGSTLPASPPISQPATPCSPCRGTIQSPIWPVPRVFDAAKRYRFAMTYRIAVWGPGNVGAPAIRAIVAHPALELAGVIVHSPEKEGQDAGLLAGLERVGVVATRDAEAVLNTQPDALFYGVNSDFRPAESQQECCDALRRGINVVCCGMYGLLHPASADPALAKPFAEACQQGASSFLTSGIDPGFAIDLLPLVLSGVCENFREIRIVENFNYAHYDQPEAVRNLVGMGRSMERTPPMLLPFAMEGVWGGALRLLADALDLEIDEIRCKVERHALEKDVTNSMGTFDAGTQGAFRFEIQGIVAGEARLVVEHITRISDETAPQWPLPAKQGHHQVRISGSPNLVVTIECEDANGDHAGGGNSAAACRLVGALPFVCDAAPGLVAATDLPLIAGRGLMR